MSESQKAQDRDTLYLKNHELKTNGIYAKIYEIPPRLRSYELVFKRSALTPIAKKDRFIKTYEGFRTYLQRFIGIKNSSDVLKKKNLSIG